MNEASFFACFLWLDAAVHVHGHTTSTMVLTQSTLFVFRWKTVWKMFSFCSFRWFQSSLTYHDSSCPHCWLRSYSGQASEGYKLKAVLMFNLFRVAFFSVLQVLTYL